MDNVRHSFRSLHTYDLLDTLEHVRSCCNMYEPGSPMSRRKLVARLLSDLDWKAAEPTAVVDLAARGS